MTVTEPTKTCVCGRSQLSNFACGLCHETFCKRCIEFVPENAFSFMQEIPTALSHFQYCLACYASTVRPGIWKYNAVMNRAKQIMIVDSPQRQPITIIKKLKEPLKVKDCPDREETIMRLAFKAAELGFNSVLKVNVSYKKVRNEGYQKMVWQGTGVAAEVPNRV